MILVLLILFVLVSVMNLFIAEKIICKPPNIFAHVFGPPGVGKTTLCGKIVRENMKNDRRVYCNVPVVGAYKFSISDLGKYEFRHCTLIIDEAGTDLSNRNWQNNLSEDQIRFLKLLRHYDVDIWTLSQAYGEVDNKFRELTTLLLMLKKSRIPFFVRAMALQKTMDLIDGQIVEYFEWDKSNSFRYFKPPTWAYFNSYQTDMKLKKREIEFRYTKSETKDKN